MRFFFAFLVQRVLIYAIIYKQTKISIDRVVYGKKYLKLFVSCKRKVVYEIIICSLLNIFELAKDQITHL